MILNKVGEMGVLVLFLILGKMLSAFHHYLVNSRFVIYGLYYFDVCFLCATFWRVFFFLSYMDVEFYQKLFLHVLRGPYGFYSVVC